jgi:DNA polymerase-3 subunit gamma/tau
VARLVDAGVDLVAFAEGAGDLWRAALAASLGAKPEGVSTALAERVKAATADLVPGDIIRILRSLDEAEEAIRRGGNPRVLLETLLARWALMDRTVDIAELIRGEQSQGSRPLPEGRARPDTGPQGPAASGASAPVIAEHGLQPVGTARSAPQPLSLDSIRAAWPAILDAIRRDRKPLVAQALTEAEVAGFDEGRMTLRPVSANPLVPETISGKRAIIEAAAARVLGSRVEVLPFDDAPGGDRDTAAPRAESPADTRPRRVTVSGARVEQTRALRGRDPSLDEAMDALDLELLE